jgi:cytochrome c
MKQGDSMKLIVTVGTVVACLAFPLSAGAAASQSEGTALSSKYNCAACHAEDRKIVGPAYKDVAKRYASDASAAAKLAGKIKSGGSGAWGAIPMPPNNVPDADLKKLVDWILSLG